MNRTELERMAERDRLTTDQLSSASDQTPERSAEDIRRDIASRRESISETVDQLSNRFEQKLDWHTYVSDHPLAALGVAAGIGFLTSGLFRHRRRSTHRVTDVLANTVEDMTDRFRYQLDDLGLKRPGLKKTIKTAAVGAIAKAAMGGYRLWSKQNKANQARRPYNREREELQANPPRQIKDASNLIDTGERE